MRIAIVGAGPAGLSAARKLVDLGHRDIVIYEREAQVGGKCFTVTHEGRRLDLGALVTSPEHTLVRGIAASAGLSLAPVVSRGRIIAGGRAIASLAGMIQLMSRRYGLLASTAALARFQRERIRHRAALAGDLAAAAPELFEPFADYARRAGITALAEAMRPFVVGFGYAFYEDVPALYHLRFLDEMLRVCAREGLRQALRRDSGGMARFRDGYQAVWEAAARGLPVRLGAEVSAIVRRQGRVEVTAGGATEVFDRVLVAVPLDAARRFLDASPEEDELLRRVRAVRYVSTVFEATGLPRATGMTELEALEPPLCDRPAWLIGLFADADLYLSYQLCREGSSDAEVEAALAAGVARAGGRLGRVIAQRSWRYFQHVGPDDLRAGFYPRFAALQGQRSTYWLGNIFSFEEVEAVATHATRLVERYFVN